MFARREAKVASMKLGISANRYWSLSHFGGICQGRAKSSNPRLNALSAAPRGVLAHVIASSPPPGELSAA
jgi:hypothetical protein